MKVSRITRDIVRSMYGARGLALALLRQLRPAPQRWDLWSRDSYSRQTCLLCGIYKVGAANRGGVDRATHERDCARRWLDARAPELVALLRASYTDEELIGIEVMCAGLAGVRSVGSRPRREGAAA